MARLTAALQRLRQRTVPTGRWPTESAFSSIRCMHTTAIRRDGDFQVFIHFKSSVASLVIVVSSHPPSSLLFIFLPLVIYHTPRAGFAESSYQVLVTLLLRSPTSTTTCERKKNKGWAGSTLPCSCSSANQADSQQSNPIVDTPKKQKINKNKHHHPVRNHIVSHNLQSPHPHGLSTRSPFVSRNPRHLVPCLAPVCTKQALQPLTSRRHQLILTAE